MFDVGRSNINTGAMELTAGNPGNVSEIMAPLLMARGANEPRVKKSESDQIVQAQRQRGVDVEYIVKENEGHGFQNEGNRFDFYRRKESSLARHLGSRAENAPPA